MKSNVILCGLPGCGKTMVGKVLADKLNWTFIDTDRLIEDYYQNMSGEFLTCRQLFITIGEEAFRQLESQIVLSLKNDHHSVTSTGGGILKNRENCDLLKSMGLLFYLKNDPQVLLQRITTDQIPAYLDPKDLYGSFQKIIKERESVYESIADIQIETNEMTQEEVASLIKQRLIEKL
jgi:shikimate kinase